ncbi:GNAT family N-acetyltransferase [Anaerobacillus sp. MEB173]|uniref:GNAT family N-acetyltransferase n=1 Tax=Anaerobacillus sp. MEB173 TaxID=3383345 RepID=UPI003F8F64C7
MIRKASMGEISVIKSYETYVQNEATVGYVNETNRLEGMTTHTPESDYYVYIINGFIVGWILLDKIVGPYTNERSGIILELFVVPQYRQDGIGKKLMNFSVDHFKSLGLRKVQLNVFAGNEAKGLYEKLGFTDVATLMEKII